MASSDKRAVSCSSARDAHWPFDGDNLKLLFLTASRMAFSVVRLSAVTTLARPFLTSTVEPTTPGNAFNRLLSLRPQPGHSHPLMRNIHLNCRCAVDFANAPREPEPPRQPRRSSSTVVDSSPSCFE